jgi:hypothetical protein
MDVENWKNCDFASCPNLGSYFCQTACGATQGVYAEPTEFMALTANACHSNIRVVNPANGNAESTAAEDVGPTTNNAYWTSGTMPNLGGCVTDALADTLGISHGCNPNHGQATVYWRFE